MRKELKVLIIIFIIVATALTMVACAKDADGLRKLKTPTDVAINGDAVSWSAVKNAQKYFVTYADKTEETLNTSFLIKGLDKGVYKIEIVAYGDGSKYGSSDPAVIEFVQGERINSPKLVINKDTKKVTWEKVENAKEYRVSAVDKNNNTIVEEKIIEENYFNFDDALFEKPNAYTLSVTAIPFEDVREYVASKISTIEYVVSAKLPTPEFTTFTTSSVRWNKVENAIKYRLTVTDSDEVVSYFDTTATNFPVSNLELTKAGKYKLTLQALGDEKIYLHSDLTTDPEDKYSLTKLESLDLVNNKVKLEEKLDTTTIPTTIRTYVTWQIEDSKVKGLKNFSISLRPYKPSGSTTLNPLDTINIEANEEKNYELKDGIRYYQYMIESKFITETTTGEGDDKTIVYSYPLANDDYYGKLYDISIKCTMAADARYISSDEVIFEDRYESYKIPELINGVYNITEVGHLAFISKNPNGKFKLSNDINCKGYPLNMIEEFTGELDGGSHIIRNFMIIGNNGVQSSAGFIGTNRGIVKDINFVGVTSEVKGAAYVGLIGRNFGEVTRTFVQGEIICDYAVVGGLIGVNEESGKVSYSQAIVNVTGQIAGGFIGVNYSKRVGEASIFECTSTGKVIARFPKLKDDEEEKPKTFDIPKIQGNETNIIAGGFIAINWGTAIQTPPLPSQGKNKQVEQPNIFRCGSTGSVEAIVGEVGANTEYFVLAGGFVGYSQHMIIDSCYSGKLYSTDDRNVEKVSRVESSGTGSRAGGFVAINLGTISNSYSNMLVKGLISGGFVAKNGGSISSCWTTKGANASGNYANFANELEIGSSIKNSYFRTGNNKNEASDAVKLTTEDWTKELMEKLGVDGKAYFGILTDSKGNYVFKGLVIKNTIYLEKHAESIKKNANLTTIGYGVGDNGAQIRVGSVVSGEITKTYDKLPNDFGKSGVALARYSNCNYVVVTIK